MNNNNLFKTLFFVCLFSFSFYPLFAQTVFYVKTTGQGNGTSWENASNNIQEMIDKAKSGDEIWVSGGTYYPELEYTPRDPQSKYFVLKDGVNLYGGFAGNETTVEERERIDLDQNGLIEPWEFANETILSGNIDGVEDVWTQKIHGKWSVTGNEGNSYYVVYSPSHLKEEMVFDGFSVTGSSTKYGMYMHGYIQIRNCKVYNNAGGGINASLCHIEGCRIYDNMSPEKGGGAYFTNNKSMKNCLIENNYSPHEGGGIYMYASGDGQFVKNCVIRGNYSDDKGGGVAVFPFLYGDLVFNNCEIYNNFSEKDGGGVACIAETFGDSRSFVLDSCVIYKNAALQYGGGASFTRRGRLQYCHVYDNYGKQRAGGLYFDYWSSGKLVSCSFIYNNYSDGQGGGIYNASNQQCSVVSSAIYNNTGTSYGGILYYSSFCKIYHCTIQNNSSWKDIGAKADDALFNEYVNPTDFIGRAEIQEHRDQLLHVDWHLRENSSLINKIKHDSQISGTTDIAGNPRMRLGYVDDSAYEYLPPVKEIPWLETFEECDNILESEHFIGWHNVGWSVENGRTVFQYGKSKYSDPDLISYPINAVGKDSVILSYTMSFEGYNSMNQTLEGLSIYVSDDDGGTWSRIHTFSNENGNILEQHYEHDISRYAAGQVFIVRFSAHGKDIRSIEKWEIGNVAINAREAVLNTPMVKPSLLTYSVQDGLLMVYNEEYIPFSVEIWDMKGLLIDKIVSSSLMQEVNLPQRGLYIVRIRSDKEVISRKIYW